MGTEKNSWWGYSEFAKEKTCIFRRGGYYSNYGLSDMFSYTSVFGNSNAFISFRPTITVY